MTDYTILSAVESEISRVEGYLVTLRQKVHAALEQLQVAGGVATYSSAEGPALPICLTTNGAFHPRGLWYRGTFRPCGTYIDIYTGLLRAIAQHDPEALPRTAAELRRHGRTRTYLAPSREQLFHNQTPDWARAHSRPIAEGWFADTNLGLDALKKLTRRILRANGLREGTDVVIFWERTPVRPAQRRPTPSAATQSQH
jgi:hypothetical protein